MESVGGTLGSVAATLESVAATIDRLRRAKHGLAERRAGDVARTLGRVGARFLDPGDALRREALRMLPETSGLSGPMSEAVLDGMARDWTADKLLRLLDVEFGGADVLDGFVVREGRRAMAVGPRLCVQIVAGSVPGVGVSALLRSLSVKGPTLLKPGRGDRTLPVLFARALEEEDPALGEALAVVYWPGGRADLEGAALAHADTVTVYGSDATVRTLRAAAPVTVRFVAYHHRVSVGFIARRALARAVADATAEDVARAVALFDQRGCVSPQVVLMERGGEVPPEAFVEALGRALAATERALPTGALGAGEASALQQARGTAELLEGAGAGRVVHGGAEPWTVVLVGGASAGLGGSLPGGRFVTVRAVDHAAEVAAILEPFGPHLQTVAVAGLEPSGEEALARALGRIGASRLTPFAGAPFPPPWWHHDGRGPLVDLVRWVDWEG